MMGKPDVRKRAMGIMARIQAATARHDPCYKLKKKGILNAHDMKRLIPSYRELMDGVKIDFNRCEMVESIVKSAGKTYGTYEINRLIRG
jgi:hypothetical protein